MGISIMVSRFRLRIRVWALVSSKIIRVTISAAPSFPAVPLGKGWFWVEPSSGRLGSSGVNAEVARGDKGGAGGAQADVAAAVSHNSCSHGSGGVVACTGNHGGSCGKSRKA